jgi:hypothetical protein
MTNPTKLHTSLLFSGAFSFGLRPQSFFCFLLGSWVFCCGLGLGPASFYPDVCGFFRLAFWFIASQPLFAGAASVKGPMSWAYLSPFQGLAAGAINPAADLDVSAATDADDLVVFVADLFEFVEHEQAMLLDSLTEAAGLGVLAGLGGVSAAASIRVYKK